MTFEDLHSSERLERALQASLRPVDPGTDFTRALLERLATAPPITVEASAASGTRQRRWHSASLALAASVVLAVAVHWQLTDVRAAQHAQAARAQEARVHAQLLLALEITSERLGMAQQRIEQYQLQENRL
jgi:hypothetical protein